MASILNADTSNGLKITSDTSGEIKLQSAGTDIATVNSSGITMASGKGLAATGHVIQVVTSEYSTTTGIGSLTYADTGITASITPSSTSSKILVIVSISGRCYSQQNGDVYYYKNIVRDTTQIHQNTLLAQSGTGALGYAVYPITNMAYVDSPSTTSSVTYKVQMKTSIITSDTRMRLNEVGGSSTMTLMEIAG